MHKLSVLSATLALCQAFTVPFMDGQGLAPSSSDGQKVFTIDIHIDSESRDGVSTRPSHSIMGSQAVSTDPNVVMKSEDLPVHASASRAQWDRGIIAATSVEPYNNVIWTGVGQNGEAYVNSANGSSWYPSYQNYYNLGGSFNHSLAIYAFKGAVYITGVTTSNNLVIKGISDNSKWYPKSKSWIILAEGTAAGTPAIASHDNKTLSIVTRQIDGTVLHYTYDPETDDQTTVPVPNRQFRSSPALLVRPGKKLQAFITDASGQMYFSEWDGGKTWSVWTGLGGDFVGDPATKWLGEKGDIWSVGKDKNAYARYYSDGGCFSATWIPSGNVDAIGTGSVHYVGPAFNVADFVVQTSGDLIAVRRDGDKMSKNAVPGATYGAPATYDFWWSGTSYSNAIVVGLDKAIYRAQRTGTAAFGSFVKLNGVFQG